MQRVNQLVECVIVILSIISGALLVFTSVYFIYGYHFTSVLWFIMFPMTTLILNFIIGCFLMISAIYIFVDKIRAAFLFRLSGIFIILYSINRNLLGLLNDSWYLATLWDGVLFGVVGILLFLFFTQKKHHIKSNNNVIKQFCLIGLICFLIDCIFYNWTYY